MAGWPPERQVFVTVGTTEFDALIEAVDGGTNAAVAAAKLASALVSYSTTYSTTTVSASRRRAAESEETTTRLAGITRKAAIASWKTRAWLATVEAATPWRPIVPATPCETSGVGYGTNCVGLGVGARVVET